MLGATALAVADLSLTGATKAAGISTSGAAALVSLIAAPGLGVTELGRRVGLSQSAAARMVDALESEGMVERRPGVGRWVCVWPTPGGERAARTLLTARGGPLSDVIVELDDADRQALDELLAKLLTRLYDRLGDAQRMCRLCDRKACTTNADCPVGAADRERHC